MGTEIRKEKNMAIKNNMTGRDTRMDEIRNERAECWKRRCGIHSSTNLPQNANLSTSINIGHKVVTGAVSLLLVIPVLAFFLTRSLQWLITVAAPSKA
jgi:hypothetical protein